MVDVKVHEGWHPQDDSGGGGAGLLALTLEEEEEEELKKPFDHDIALLTLDRQVMQFSTSNDPSCVVLCYIPDLSWPFLCCNVLYTLSNITGGVHLCCVPDLHPERRGESTCCGKRRDRRCENLSTVDKMLTSA